MECLCVLGGYSAIIATESKGDFPLAESKTPADGQVREEVLRLLELWESMSEGTKLFLQSQCDHRWVVLVDLIVHCSYDDTAYEPHASSVVVLFEQQSSSGPEDPYSQGSGWCAC